MKFLLITALTLILLAGCSRPEHPIFQWSPASKAADSIVYELELAYISNKSPDSIATLTHQLEILSREKNAPDVLKARTKFWQGRNMLRLGRQPEAQKYLSEALALLDSSTYAYDAQRISHLIALLPYAPLPEKYNRLKNAEKYYSKNHDDFMLAHVSADLGIISERLGGLRNPHDILEYYKTADSLYLKLGLKDYHTKNLINLAQGYINIGDSAHCRKIIDYLLKHPSLRRDSVYHDIVLLSAGGWFNDIPKLQELFNRSFRRNPSMALEASMLLHDHFLAEDCPDSASFYIKYAYDNISFSPNKGHRAFILENYARSMQGMLSPDSTLAMMDSAMTMQRDYIEQNNLLEVARIGKVYEIERLQTLHAETLKQRSLWFGIIIIGIISIVIFVASQLIISKQKERVHASMLQLESERKSRRLAAITLAMTEKDNVLSALIDDINKLGAEHKLSAAEVRLLEQNFRVHMSTQSEWDSFIHSFEEVNPNFMRDIKGLYPALSEGDLRLAAYLKMGLGLKQIARMMGIQPESVKKNRHRLRSRMGLSSEQSLEDILRNIGGQQSSQNS